MPPSRRSRLNRRPALARLASLARLPAAIAAVVATASGAVAQEQIAWVVGANDGLVSRVDLETGAVAPGVFAVGSTPNRIEASADGTWAVVVNSGSDDVTALDLVGETVIGSVALPPGANPWAAEVLGPRVFVTALRGNAVHEIDVWSGTVLATAPVGQGPEGMVVAEGKLYVANTGFDFDDFTYAPGTVSVLDAASLAPLALIDVGLNPQECLATPDGRVHVVCTGDFGATPGVVHVVDPTLDAVVDSLNLDGYPGGGAVFADGSVHLNVTTPAFSSEIRSYDASTLTWTHDESDPLLPSFSFYGNVRVDAVGRVLVPDFTQDLLILENPSAPGSPVAILVGDGPIDVAVTEREQTVPILVSGLSGSASNGRIRLEWRSTPEAGVLSFAVERRRPGGEFSRVASGIRPAHRVSWVDEAPEPGPVSIYRVGAVDVRGRIQWTSPVRVDRETAVGDRLALRRTFPNPFREGMTLDVVSPVAAEGRLEVLDARGRRTASRAYGTVSAGAATLVWDGRDDGGRPVAPGVYFLRLVVGRESVSTRAVRLR